MFETNVLRSGERVMFWVDVKESWLRVIQEGGVDVKLWLYDEDAFIVQGASIWTGDEISEKGTMNVLFGKVRN